MPTTGPDPHPPRLSAATTVVGVIGDPVAHSLSPLLHNAAFAELGLDWVSVGFRVPAGSAADAHRRGPGPRCPRVVGDHAPQGCGGGPGGRPLAAGRAPGCRQLRDLSASTGSFGDNTDGPGLVAALRRGDRFDPAGRNCLVIGGGGAARAVVAALADAGAAEVVVVNRTPERAASAAALAGAVGRVGSPADAAGCQLVVNATPLGMAAADGGSSPSWPLDPTLLRAGQVVVDLVYHPRVTPWLEAARGRGAAVSNGIGMLVHQAALQLAGWTGLEPPVEAMWRAVERARPGGVTGVPPGA